ncbi:CDGSH iron-sulfur domain-containing protein 2 homolog isoform X1 [Schistocerca americana]|uniref:CDGSH iron-sulfur domain-containing protein 2 homolog isoform X1 n=1 Tax=Schistocerca americana TaxID=7009 RepID=UPI001F4FF1DE|nr:CDGSH iron-sulfur domain-containing protein 2 homolog isoform X1 [Schistocerca americana]XP_047109792.1 CDGSH iron-sulfur domain-containing protein 2 homolog isoform X1 [Schistocerca piceifrons]XP_049764745.1 CDGSH iron-sulfur domain-containing protein 2 homolog isoform X1 [Schistocerca cancellata]XP_049941740.1 CDGSH iron-sulfur domain-containing protein 2 homolog isoform X1 [Schistocerca serialis cubense]
MEPVSNFVKESVPTYLSNLPIPKTFEGWSKLEVRDWTTLIPLGASIAAVTFLTYKAFGPGSKKTNMINPDIRKDLAKVADVFDIEDIGDKVSFCRCWRSKKFPYCDGTHNKVNQETGDNVGPVVLKHKE